MQDGHDLAMSCGRYGVVRTSVLTARSKSVCSTLVASGRVSRGSFRGPTSIARGVCRGDESIQGEIPSQQASDAGTITLTDNFKIHRMHAGWTCINI